MQDQEKLDESVVKHNTQSNQYNTTLCYSTTCSGYYDVRLSGWKILNHVTSSMQNDDNGYGMFLGRWQPFHIGHQTLFQQLLARGKKICIMIRDMPIDEKNPYTAKEVKNTIESYFADRIKLGTVIVMVVPNITSINFGRNVGYDIVEHIPPANIALISGTKIRNNKL